MTKSFDELFAPKAMSLDELFAAIQPPPLLPVSYPPSGNIDFMSPSFAGGVNAPQPIPLNQFMPRTTPAPQDTYNFGYPGSGVPGNGNDEALASIESDDMLNHILARQAAGLRPLPDYSLAVQTPQQDRSWPGVQPAPLQQLNYPSAPGNPSDDTGLSPLDDWQKRGSETAASALSIPYPKDGPLPA